MKNLVYIFVFSLFVLATAMKSVPSGEINTDKGIQFQQGNWNEVLELAKKENKLIFLDVYATWCGPCKQMKSKTFPDEKVGAFFNSNFINYAIDAEKGEGIALAKKYQVTGYPTLLFVDSKGNVVAKTVGFHNADELLEVGHKMIGK
jgi:thiol:disulfide interchange protein